MDLHIISLVILFVLILTLASALLGLAFYLAVRLVKALIKWVKKEKNT